MSMRIKGAAWPAGVPGSVRVPDDGPAHGAADAPADGPRCVPDAFDAERVAALRLALAQGRVPFDAAKLAALILRYHRSGR